MQSKREKAIQIQLKKNLKTVRDTTIDKNASVNEREQAIIALKNQNGIDVRSDGNTPSDVLQRTRRLLLEADKKQRPFSFAHKGKLYETDVNEVHKEITVTELIDNVGGKGYRKGKTISLKGKDADRIAKAGGGYFTDKVIVQLDKEGKLP